MRIKKSKLKQIIREELNEAGFARTRQAMTGIVPTIETIAFLTGENPGGEPAPPAVNKENNAALEKRLRSRQLWVQKNQGKVRISRKVFHGDEYSSQRSSYILGQDFGQEAIIWGEKQEDDEGVYFNFEYIEGDDHYRDPTGFHVGSTDVQDREDFYSQVKGRKFLIPFFDDEYEGASMKVKADLNELTENSELPTANM